MPPVTQEKPTEVEASQEALRATEERFRALFDLGPTAAYSCDASGTIREFNRRAAELWGREPALGDADERFCGSFKLFRPDSSFMPHEQCPMADVVSGKLPEVRDGEVLIERPDGSRVTVVVNIRPLKNQRGELTGAINCFYDITARKQAEGNMLKAGALQSAIFNSANFSSIATDAKGVIQIFNVGAERMLGYTAAEVMNKITPADISDPQEVIARAGTLSVELGTPITPGFEALVFKASRGIEDIYELTYIRKDGSRFPAVVSVTALRDAQGTIIGYLLIGTDNTARKQAEEALLKAGALQSAIFNSANFSSIATDAKGVIQIFNVGAERMLGYAAAEVMNKITPADISDPEEGIARAKALSVELGTRITPGFEALVFKASRGIEDIYELTNIRKDEIGRAHV